MSPEIEQKLASLKQDYRRVRGRDFHHFFCPILFKDEETPLCEAHLINKDLPNTPRRTTVQRADVDSFYGTHFESDFIDVGYRQDGPMESALINKDRARRLRPEIQKDGKRIQYYKPGSKDIPGDHTPIEFTDGIETIPLILKIDQKEIFSPGSKWEIAINKDLRLPSLVSLIKSAHIILFDLLGYRYALSASGHFTGNDILGRFYRENIGKGRGEVRTAGLNFFKQFIHMVRPVESNTMNLEGTIRDNIVFVCRQQNWCWGMIVFVPVSGKLHSVMVPVIEHPEAGARYLNFLNTENEFAEGSFCKIRPEFWEMDKQIMPMLWPKTDVSICLE